MTAKYQWLFYLQINQNFGIYVTFCSVSCICRPPLFLNKQATDIGILIKEGHTDPGIFDVEPGILRTSLISRVVYLEEMSARKEKHTHERARALCESKRGDKQGHP